jgi:hypothetical protein
MAEDNDSPAASELEIFDDPDDPDPLKIVQSPLDRTGAQAGGDCEPRVSGIGVGLSPGELAQEDLEQEPPGSFEAGATQDLAFEGAARNPDERHPVDGPGPSLRTATGSGVDPGVAAS